MQQLLEERDAELERTEASLEGHQKGGQAREAVSPAATTCPLPLQAVSDIVCHVLFVHGPYPTNLSLKLLVLVMIVPITAPERITKLCGTCCRFIQSVHYPLGCKA